MRNILAAIGALLAMFCIVPYIVDIFRRKTRPNIVTWITWTLLTAIATAAAFAAHQPRTALLTLGTTICTLSVIVAGLKYGIAKFTFFDGVCQASAIIGIVLWQIFNSPELAIVIVVMVDCVGLIPTLKHSWLEPSEETWQTYAIGAAAPVFTLLSLTFFSVSSTAYPLYLLLADFTLAVTILYRRKTLS